MDILKPEDKTLELLATELGFVIFDEKLGIEQKPNQDVLDDKNRTPATIKPFTQLT